MTAKEKKLERQKRLREIYSPDKGSRELADLLGCSSRTVSTDLLEMGIRLTGEYPRRVNTEFFDGWNRENAYVFGYFCGDGSIITQGKYSRMHICSKDRMILEKIRESMKGKQAIRESVVPGHELYGRYVKETIVYEYVVADHRFMEGLFSKGAQEDKTNKGLKFYPDVPVEYQRDVVRGLFDSDGSVSFTQNNLQMYWLFSEEEMCDWVLGMIPFSVKKQTRVTDGGRTLWWIRCSNSSECRKIARWMYEGTNFYLERKYRVFGLSKER